MNWKHLIWIIPLCLLLGYLLGLYFNLPQTLTIEAGEDLVYVSEQMQNFHINYSGCPDCQCGNEFVNQFWNLYEKENTENCDNGRVLSKIVSSIHRIETKIQNNVT